MNVRWFLVLFMTTGCAHLRVEVAVLNNECAHVSPGTFTDAQARLYRVTKNLAGQAYDRARAAIKADVRRVAGRLVETGVWEPASKNNKLDRVDQFVDGQFASIIAAYRAAVDKASGGDGAGADDAIAVADRTLKRLADAVSKQFGAPATEAAVALLAEIRSAAESQLTGLLAGLRDDPLAGVIAAADDQCWSGVFNRAWASSRFGNSDIAIKMEPSGDFTLKGIRLDASKVTQATFQALGQGIKLLAATAGVPAKAGASTGDDAGAALQQAATDTVATEAKAQIYRITLISLLDTIVQQRDHLADHDSRVAALKVIQSAYDGYRAQLAPSN